MKVLTNETINKIKEEQGSNFVYVGMTWEEYLTLGQYFNELLKKFKEYNVLLCHYRKDLEESICGDKGEK